VGVHILWPGGESKLVEAVASFLSYLLLAWVIKVHCARNEITVSSILGEDPSNREAVQFVLLGIPLIGIALAGLYVVFLPLSWVKPEWVITLLNVPQLLQSGRVSDQLLTTALDILTLVVIGPIVEEILFRGFLLNRWWEKYGLERAIIASSVAFGIMHIEFIGGTIFGLVLSRLYVKTRSLIGPILIHMSNNAIVVLFGAADAMMTGKSSEFNLAEFQSGWWMAPIGLTIGLPWLRWFYVRYLGE
jgi:CAAX protease family protein